jgi:hypothetical protein
MPKVAWDSTFETCVQREMDGLLVADQPLLLRSGKGLYTGRIPAISADEIESMVGEFAPSLQIVHEVPGCRSFCVRYGDEQHFRLDVLGSGSPRAVLITRLSDEVSRSLHSEIKWFEGWTVAKRRLGWMELLSDAEATGHGHRAVERKPAIHMVRLGTLRLRRSAGE